MFNGLASHQNIRTYANNSLEDLPRGTSSSVTMCGLLGSKFNTPSDGVARAVDMLDGLSYHSQVNQPPLSSCGPRECSLDLAGLYTSGRNSKRSARFHPRLLGK